MIPNRFCRRVVDQKRERARGPLQEYGDSGKGLPAYEKHLAETWQELDTLAAQGEEG